MDETGARVAVPSGEEVVVLIECKELYTPSPSNRKSLTVIETVNAAGKALPAFVIAPGKKIMENWINANLDDNDTITCSLTGYTSNEGIIEYLDHFIRCTNSGLSKPWNMLLCDGYTTYEFPDFVVKAFENHIRVYIFPSHETHAL